MRAHCIAHNLPALEGGYVDYPWEEGWEKCQFPGCSGPRAASLALAPGLGSLWGQTSNLPTTQPEKSVC